MNDKKMMPEKYQEVTKNKISQLNKTNNSALVQRSTTSYFFDIKASPAYLNS